MLKLTNKATPRFYKWLDDISDFYRLVPREDNRIMTLSVDYSRLPSTNDFKKLSKHYKGVIPLAGYEIRLDGCGNISYYKKIMTYKKLKERPGDL